METLKITEKIIRENAVEHKKKKRGLSALGLRFCSSFSITLPMHCFGKHFVLIITMPQIKGSVLFCKLELRALSKKAGLKISLNPELNLTIFQGSGP